MSTDNKVKFIIAHPVLTAQRPLYIVWLSPVLIEEDGFPASVAAAEEIIAQLPPPNEMGLDYSLDTMNITNEAGETGKLLWSNSQLFDIVKPRMRKCNGKSPLDAQIKVGYLIKDAADTLKSNMPQVTEKAYNDFKERLARCAVVGEFDPSTRLSQVSYADGMPDAFRQIDIKNKILSIKDVHLEGDTITADVCIDADQRVSGLYPQEYIGLRGAAYLRHREGKPARRYVEIITLDWHCEKIKY